jgi:hypothetical protein
MGIYKFSDKFLYMMIYGDYHTCITLYKSEGQRPSDTTVLLCKWYTFLTPLNGCIYNLSTVRTKERCQFVKQIISLHYKVTRSYFQNTSDIHKSVRNPNTVTQSLPFARVPAQGVMYHSS